MTTARSEKRTQFLLDVLTTAFEGGIGYWCFTRRYDIWEDPTVPSSELVQKKDPQLYIFDYQAPTQDPSDIDPEATWWKDVDWDKLPAEHIYLVNLDVIERGLRVAWQKDLQRDPKSYWRQMFKCDMTDSDEGDYDAGIADDVLQFGLFSESIYG